MGYKDKVRNPLVHGMSHFAYEGIFPYTTPSVAITGTCSPACLESEVVTGGQTILLTISQGKWAASGTTFNAARQAILNGLVAAEAEAAGWNIEVSATGKQAVTTVVRTSDTVVTITLTASAAYATTADETVTVTVPGAAMEGQWAPVVAGTFTVTSGS